MRDHISVCVCTFKRPLLLKNLLLMLEDQDTQALFDYSVVVVDNDASASALQTVRALQANSVLMMDYHVEPEQNIALARNKAVQNAKGNFIAFLDDDEYPSKEWLINLYRTCKAYDCDGVLGPVKADYPDDTPEWLVKSRICERETHPTGTILHWSQTRTGNVLFNMSRLHGKGMVFKKEFGRTGGEDIELFKMLMSKGCTFIWCNEAMVRETVLPERWVKSYHFKKYLRIGGLTGEKIRRDHLNPLLVVKVALSFAAYLILFPFSYLAGEHAYARALIKLAYHFGRLSGLFGWVVLRDRDD